MKLSLFIAISVLASSCLGQLVCENNNALISRYAAAGVKINTHPVTEAAFCPGLWSAKGTCCSTTQTGQTIQEYVARDKLSVKKMIEDVFTEMVPIIKIIQDKVASMSKDELKTIGWDNGEKDTIRTIEGLLKDRKEFVEEKVSKCLDGYASFREKAVCNVCAGNAPVFFENTKLKITSKTCREVIDSCLVPWRRILTLTRRMGNLVELLTKLGLESNETSARTQLLKRWAEDLKIAQALEDCKAPLIEHRCPTETAAIICDNMITVSGNVLLKELKAEEKLLADQTKRSASSRRLLNTVPLTTGRGDVLMVPINKCDPTAGCAGENNFGEA